MHFFGHGLAIWQETTIIRPVSQHPFVHWESVRGNQGNKVRHQGDIQMSANQKSCQRRRGRVAVVGGRVLLAEAAKTARELDVLGHEEA